VCCLPRVHPYWHISEIELPFEDAIMARTASGKIRASQRAWQLAYTRLVSHIVAPGAPFFIWEAVSRVGRYLREVRCAPECYMEWGRARGGQFWAAPSTASTIAPRYSTMISHRPSLSSPIQKYLWKWRFRCPRPAAELFCVLCFVLCALICKLPPDDNHPLKAKTSRKINTASKLKPPTQTDRRTCPGVFF